jgi:hypothetical protein
VIKTKINSIANEPEHQALQQTLRIGCYEDDRGVLPRRIIWLLRKAGLEQGIAKSAGWAKSVSANLGGSSPPSACKSFTRLAVQLACIDHSTFATIHDNHDKSSSEARLCKDNKLIKYCWSCDT